MIEDNKIKHREQSSINKNHQSFISFLQELRKQRKQRLVPLPPQNIQIFNSPSSSDINPQEITHSQFIQQHNQPSAIKPAQTYNKPQQPTFNKQVGDSALKYRSRINMHYKQFFHHYKFSPNWFLQTQKQLDQYLKSSRVIPQRQTRQNISLNLSRLAKQVPSQHFQSNKHKRQSNRQTQKDKLVPQKQWIIKTARERKQPMRYEDEEDINAEQHNQNNRQRDQRQTRSQYFQQINKKTKPNFQLDPFQSKETQRRPRQSYNDLQHCRQFSYAFGQQMPFFPQMNEPRKRRIQVKPQGRKGQLKPIQKPLADELLEQQPLRMKR